MDFLSQLGLFIFTHASTIGLQVLIHLGLALVAVCLAVLIGVPLARALERNRSAAHSSWTMISILCLVPAIVLLGISTLGLAQLGFPNAAYPSCLVIGMLFATLPVVDAVRKALHTLSPSLQETAQALGLTQDQRLRMLEWPLARPYLVAGLRNALVSTIGLITLAAYSGSSGLGIYIRDGIATDDRAQLFVGIIMVALLAWLVDSALRHLQRRLSPPGSV